MAWCAGLACGQGPVAPAQPTQPAGAASTATSPPTPTPPTPTPPTTTPPTATPDESLEDRLIRDVRIRRLVPPAKRGEPFTLGDLDGQTERLVLNQIRSRAGGPYNRARVSEDIERINRLGRFVQVESRVELLGDGSVNLVFTLRPTPVIADVQVVGNKALSDQEILPGADVLVGTPADPFQIDRAARSIEDQYRSRGYYLAKVTVNRTELDDSGVVIFEVKEGERVRVMRIDFEGNASFREAEFSDTIKTKVAGLLESGPLDDATLDDDVAALARFYRDRGYLDVRVDRLVTPAPNGKEAIVRFVIDEGRVFTLRTVRLEYDDLTQVFADEAAAREYAGEFGTVESPPGVEKTFVARRPGPFSTEQAMGLMLIKPGDVYSADKLNKSVTSLEQAFGKLGYFGEGGLPGVRIERRELRDPAEPRVDVQLRVSRLGTPSRVGEVIVTGNDITKTKVVHRQVTLLPERPLDPTQVEETIRRLDQINLFEPRSVKIAAQAPDPLEPEYRDVIVEVKETNTGSLSAGGAISSDAALTGTISFKQRNFDVADTPDTFGELISGRAFRGAGQTFALDLAPGSRAQTYRVSLSDPYLLESDYSGSAALSYRTRDYREYDERRYGANFALGRRFGSRWNATVPIRIEAIDLSDIDPSEPVDYFAVEDENVLTGVGLALTRSTLNNAFVPTKGARVELGIEQVGVLGGDFDFTVLKAEHEVFLPIDEDFRGRATVLSLNTRVSLIPQGQDAAPVYERFYLGGNNFRGFSLRTISPRGIRNDTSELGSDPVGGSFSFFWGVQINQPLFDDILSGVAFIDTGTVNEEPSLDNYRVSVGVGLRVNIRALSPAPLAFDFGVPVLRQDNDRERVFTFTVDIPF